MPVGLDHVQAAAIPLAGQTAYKGLFRRGKLKAGETVLIHGGSGGVGHFGGPSGNTSRNGMDSVVF
jgi:NADPH:quinone reductase-like Zn-dependent oxidoreductase